MQKRQLILLCSAGTGGLTYVNEKNTYEHEDEEQREVLQDDAAKEQLQAEELGNLARQASHHSSYSKVDGSVNPFEPSKDSALDPVCTLIAALHLADRP